MSIRATDNVTPNATTQTAKMQTVDGRAAFYPANESFGWYHGAWPLLKLFVWASGMARFELPREDADKILAVYGNAALFCPNHPTVAEGPLMFLICHRLKIHCLGYAALEIYAKFGPLGPYLLPGIGAVSVRRRLADHASTRAVRGYLANRRSIAFFPEGELSGMSDRVMPLERGGVQMAFWGMNDLHAARPYAPLYLVPMGIKYYDPNPDAAARQVLQSLARLEAHFDLASASGRGGVWRLRRIENAYLAGCEAAAGLAPGGGLNGNARWERVRQARERQIADTLGCDAPSPAHTTTQRARDLLNAWDAAWFAHGPKGPRKNGAEWTRLQDLQKQVAWHNRFMGFDEDYVASWPSVERFGDILRRLEAEVLGKHSLTRKRVARIRIGEPINIADRADAYKKNRRATVAETALDLHTRLSAVLDEMTHELTQPWAGAFDAAPTGAADNQAVLQSSASARRGETPAAPVA